MSNLPTETLSHAFASILADRKLVSAVFTTFQLDPDFFELEILPVFLGTAVSPVPSVARVQLEDSLRTLPGEIAVYYDANGLCVGDNSHARLDVRRHPVQLAAGRIFHPKVVFAIVEDAVQPGVRSVIVGTQSANLTRSGWWENIEIAHLEELGPSTRSAVASGAIAFLRRLKQKTAAGSHRAIDDVLDVLRAVPAYKRRSEAGRLHTQFLAMHAGFVDALEQATGKELAGMNLEVISPYFDTSECKPIIDLIDRFKPPEVRVWLPKTRTGEAGCSRELFNALDATPLRAKVSWSKPEEGAEAGARGSSRFCHAKVYRFFSEKPAREILVCGSVNATQAAHKRHRNVEAAVLTELPLKRKPQFWSKPIQDKPTHFVDQREEGESALGRGTRLQLRYNWATKRASAWWDDRGPAGELQLTAAGVPVLSIVAGLAPSTWTDLPAAASADVGRALERTSLFSVSGDREGTVPLLVQEEEMEHKPSLVLDLSPADILRYWSLLTPEQRATFIEVQAATAAIGSEFASVVRPLEVQSDLFSEYAGVFHAFGALERSVSAAIEAGRTKEAVGRLFGRKYDSLGHLLDQLGGERPDSDVLQTYLILLCAQQLLQEIESRYPAFWAETGYHSKGVRQGLAAVRDVRAQLKARNGPEFEPFLQWFERHFVRRAVAKVDA